MAQMVSDFSYYASEKQVENGEPQFDDAVVLQIEETGQGDGRVQLAIDHSSGRYVVQLNPKLLLTAVIDAVSE